MHGVVGNKQVNGAAERAIQTISQRVLTLWNEAIVNNEIVTLGVFQVMVAEATASYNNKCNCLPNFNFIRSYCIGMLSFQSKKRCF